MIFVSQQHKPVQHYITTLFSVYIQVMQWDNMANYSSNVSVTYQGWANTNYGKDSTVSYQIYSKEYYENNALLNQIKENTTKRLMPNLYRKCTILLVSNLAEPQWVSVSCTQSLLPNVVCSLRAPGERFFPGKLYNMCPYPMVSTIWEVNRKPLCLIFVWFVLQEKHVKRKKLKDICTAGFPSQIKKFKPVFTEISEFQHDVIRLIYPTNVNSFKFYAMSNRQIQPYELKRTSYEWFHRNNYGQLFNLEKKDFGRNETNQIFPCFSFPIVNITSTKHLMQIVSLEEQDKNEEHFVSKKFICEKEFRDEIWRFSYMYGSKTLQCNCSKMYQYSALFYMSRQNVCESHIQHKTNQTHLPESLFVCQNGKNIDHKLQNDLVSDCEEDEDELIYTSILRKEILSSHTCQDPNYLPCEPGHPKCYHIRNICVYRLDELGHLFPCRTGSHLQDCYYFIRKSKGYFKCAEYYIPWSYVLDGKWDCTTGDDESLHRKEATCHKKLKCKGKGNICVDQIHICDDNIDCPEAEDEYLCDVNVHVLCHETCVCVNLAVVCISYTKNYVDDWYKHFVSYHIVHSELQNIDTMSHINVKIINVTHNQLICGCFDWSKEHKLYKLDLSFNKINQLKESCFSHLPALSVLNLDNNNISILEYQTFNNLKVLNLLNLSQCNVSTISEQAFFKISKLCVLLLHNNPLTDINWFMFVNTNVLQIFADSFQLCCCRPAGSTCSAVMPWDITCFTLFPNSEIRACSITLASLIAILNIASLTINLYKISKHYKLSYTKRKDDKSAGPYNIMTCFVNVGDLLCSIYLTLILHGDRLYGDEFVLKIVQWKKSLACVSAFSIIFLFTFFTPLLIMFLTLGRLMVVKNPFDSKFKSTKFVLTLMIAIVTTSIGTTTGTAVSYLFLYSIPNVFCMPFVDPRKSLTKTYVYTVLNVVIQTVAVLSMFAMHILLLREVKKSHKESGSGKVNVKILVQIILLTVSTTFCWIPVSVTFLVAYLLDRYPPQMLVWTTVAVMPVSSIVNPIVYSPSVRK